VQSQKGRDYMQQKQLSKTFSRWSRPQARSGPGALFALLAGLSASACGGDQGSDQPSSGTEEGSGVDSLERDLSIGAQGDDVRALHAYLARFGYFPNEELASEHPTWAPLLPEGPASPDVFDDQSRKAVSLLQAYYGLERTGVVDQATREALHQPRCGNPEGIALDGSEKFSIIPQLEGGARWGSTVSYRVVNGDAEVPLSAVRSVMANAVDLWRDQTTLTINEVTSGGNITVTFAAIDGPGGLLNQMSGHNIILDTAETWTNVSPPPAGQVYLETILTHSFGHSLGIGHSSMPGAVMKPTYTGRIWPLQLDDKAAVSAMYDSWMTMAGGKGLDIGAGADGSVWAVSDNDSTGGNSVRKFVSTPGGEFWVAASGTGGRSVSVSPSGQPWVVEADGTVKRLSNNNPDTGTWEEIVIGCAKDIGIGAEGSVWAIGCRSNGNGFNIMKWDGTKWVNSNGSAVRVAVAPNGIPWVLNAGNTLYRRTSTSPTSGSWEAVPGTWPSAATGTDIAINTTPSSPGNYAWLVGTGGDPLAKLNAWIEQPAIDGAPSQAGWAGANKAPGSTRVAVDPHLRVWLIGDDNRIFRSRQ
jgi:hypothetical protein